MWTFLTLLAHYVGSGIVSLIVLMGLHMRQKPEHQNPMFLWTAIPLSAMIAVAWTIYVGFRIWYAT